MVSLPGVGWIKAGQEQGKVLLKAWRPPHSPTLVLLSPENSPLSSLIGLMKCRDGGAVVGGMVLGGGD